MVTSILFLTLVLSLAILILINKLDKVIDKVNLLENIISDLVEKDNIIKDNNDIEEFLRNFIDI